jgi:hypothetical protein
MSKKRPWTKLAKIERIERNNGDVQFVATHPVTDDADNIIKHERLGPFEALTAAEKALDDWWEEWWPVQVKSRRPA